MKENTFVPRIKLKYPEFEYHTKMNEVLGGALAYSFYDCDGKEWFLEFVNRLYIARDERKYLPLYRMGDGEYTFLLGKNIYNFIPFSRLGLKQKVFKLKEMFSNKRDHSSGTSTDGKESYSKEELIRLKNKFISDLKFVSEKGILGLGLDNGKFYGKYMPYVQQAFKNNNITLNRENYYHVYHVYAFFGSKKGIEFMQNQNVLIVTSLTVEKKKKFADYMDSIEVKNLYFYNISPDKSMLDVLDLNKIPKDTNIALIGAGVGSVNILKQLEPLSIPCLDVGTVLGNMLDEERIHNRPFMANDGKFDLNKISYISKDQKHKLKASGIF